MQRFGVLFCVMAACTTSAQTPGPSTAAGAPQERAQGEPAEARSQRGAQGTATIADDVTRYDREGDCEPARGMVQVDFSQGYTLVELVTWYMDVTCRMALIPRVVLERRTARAVSERVDAARADELFKTLLDHLRLVDMGNQDIIVVSPPDRDPMRGPSLGLMAGRLPRRPRPPPDDTAKPPEEVNDYVRMLDASIRTIDETHYTIRKDLVEQILGNPAEHSRKARIVPAIKDGETIGFKLYALRPDSLLGRLGFRNGDTLQAINGMSMTTPDKALDVYVALRYASRIEIDLIRRGKPVRLVIDIVAAR